MLDIGAVQSSIRSGLIRDSGSHGRICEGHLVQSCFLRSSIWPGQKGAFYMNMGMGES